MVYSNSLNHLHIVTTIFTLPLLTNTIRNPRSLFQLEPWNKKNFVKYILGNLSKFDFVNITSNIVLNINLNNLKYDLYFSNGMLKMEFYRILMNISNRRFILVQISQGDREYRLKEQFTAYSVL